MIDGYSAIYNYYDSFTGNVDYNRRADFIESIFYKYGKPQTILDLGCGTGSLMRLLLDKGFDVIGVDKSPDMLQVAMEKNPGQLLICQDIASLDLYGTVQGVICMQDTLNHLKDLDQLKNVIKRVSLFLESDCLFIFDINSEHKHKDVLSDNVFVYENKEAFLVWQNATDKDLKVRMRLDMFQSADGGNKYKRESGYIEEIFISEESISHILTDSGLTVLEKYDGDTLSELSDSTERILYVSRKQ